MHSCSVTQRRFKYCGRVEIIERKGGRKSASYLIFSGRTFLGADDLALFVSAQIPASLALAAVIASTDARFVATAYSIRRTRRIATAAFHLAVLLIPAERSLVILALRTGGVLAAVRTEAILFVFLFKLKKIIIRVGVPVQVIQQRFQQWSPSSTHRNVVVTVTSDVRPLDHFRVAKLVVLLNPHAAALNRL